MATGGHATVLSQNVDDLGDFPVVPRGLLPTGIAVTVALWITAIALVRFTRDHPISSWATAGLIAGPAVVLVAAGLPGLVVHDLVPLAGPLFALIVLLAIRGRRPRHAVAALAAGGLAGLPYVIGSLAWTVPVPALAETGTDLMRARRDSNP
jgi:hypothetical protein